MRADRGAGRQQLLGHDIAFEHAAPAAAIALGPGHADPATRPEPPAESRGTMAAKVAVWHPQPRRQFPGDELAHFCPQRLAFGRQLDGIETEGGTHVWRTIRRHRPTLQSGPPGLTGRPSKPNPAKPEPNRVR